MNKISIAIVAAAALGATRIFGDTTADNPASVEARARAGIEKGLDWLLACQQTNGVWSSKDFPALTALPAWALSASGREKDQEAIRKAADFIKGCAQADGGIYAVVPGRRGGSLGTYNTAICMTALHYCDNAGSTRIIQKAREYVAATQLLGDDEYRGGFGYEKGTERPYADLNNSSWAISAMRLTQDVEERRPAGEKRVDIDWDAALGFVDRMQLKPGQKDVSADDAGGFLYKPETKKGGMPPGGKPPAGMGGKPPEGGMGDRPAMAATATGGRPMLRSYGSITYSGILSMIYAQVGRDDPRVVSAIDYARRHWTLDENPGMGQQGVYYYFTIMARALSLLDIDALPSAKEGGEPIPWRDELVEKVLSLQNEDGSWANGNNRFWEANPVLSTSYGVLTLQYALRLYRGDAKK